MSDEMHTYVACKGCGGSIRYSKSVGGRCNGCAEELIEVLKGERDSLEDQSELSRKLHESVIGSYRYRLDALKEENRILQKQANNPIYVTGYEGTAPSKRHDLEKLEGLTIGDWRERAMAAEREWQRLGDQLVTAERLLRGWLERSPYAGKDAMIETEIFLISREKERSHG